MAEADPLEFSPERVHDMAATVGVHLSRERAEVLATQATPHFALLRALDAFVHPHTEPAAVFRLAATEDSHGA